MRAGRTLAVAGVIAAPVVFMILAIGCSRTGDGLRPVRIDADETTGSMYLFPPVWESVQMEGEPQGLLLRDGDLVQGVVPFSSGDGPLLRIRSSDWDIRFSGKVMALAAGEDSALEWIRGATDRDIAEVRTLVMPESLGASAESALVRFAAANPNIGLSFESEDVFRRVLPRFRPRVLMLSGFSSDLRPSLGSLGDLETLVMSASDSLALVRLPGLPRLRRLYLDVWSARAGPLPAGLTGLRSLAIGGGDALKDPSVLRSVPANLEELFMTGSDSLDLMPLAACRGLRTIILSTSSTSGDLSVLSRFPRLRRLGLPRNVTQEQFDALTLAHPRLEVLEMLDSGQVTDLSPLRRLSHLEGLVMGTPARNVDVLRQLTSLRFVGLLSDSTQASRDQRAAVRKWLPDALVVPVAPYCLGSGWLLLLVPGAALIWWLERRRRSAKAGIPTRG